MIKIRTIRDEKTGRFQTTTNTTKYKMVQFNHQRMSEHARTMCISLNIPKIPKGFIIHHIDENKRNNNIDNLSLITITAHNRIHSHEAWNKGMNKGKNKKWDNALNKIRLTREKFYKIKNKETFELYNTGKTQQEVADLLGITRTTVSLRLKNYGKFKKN